MLIHNTSDSNNDVTGYAINKIDMRMWQLVYYCSSIPEAKKYVELAGYNTHNYAIAPKKISNGTEIFEVYSCRKEPINIDAMLV